MITTISESASPIFTKFSVMVNLRVHIMDPTFGFRSLGEVAMATNFEVKLAKLAYPPSFGRSQ